MAKQINNKSKAKKMTVNHSFRGCRDVVIAGNASNTAVAASITTSSSGSYAYSWPLAPVGLTTAVYTTTAYTSGTSGNIFPPILRGLYNKAIDFQWYRILRAKMIFVGNVGSTTAGTVTLAGYTDPSDVAYITNAANTSSTYSAKSFDLANSSSRELSVAIPVDSAWKKVSSQLLVPGASSPFIGLSSTMLVPVNSVSDLCFGAVSVSVVGAAASVVVGYIYIDYDVEFKGVIDSAVNI